MQKYHDMCERESKSNCFQISPPKFQHELSGPICKSHLRIVSITKDFIQKRITLKYKLRDHCFDMQENMDLFPRDLLKQKQKGKLSPKKSLVKMWVELSILNYSQRRL
jgi:hypothetical protein